LERNRKNGENRENEEKKEKEERIRESFTGSFYTT
jgi:hypothetical protein